LNCANIKKIHVTPIITAPVIKKAKNLPAMIFALVIDLEKTISSVPSSFGSLKITTVADAQINAKIIIVYDWKSINEFPQTANGERLIVNGTIKSIKIKNNQ
jgi:hypothetical protein